MTNLKAYKAAYYIANRDVILARAKAYYEAHREGRVRRGVGKNLIRKSWLRATRSYGEEVDWSIWQTVWAGPCFSCGVQPARGVDHVLARANDGRNIVENLQPACFPCNRRKGAR